MAKTRWQFGFRHILGLLAICACVCMIPVLERQANKESLEFAGAITNLIGEEFVRSGRYPSGSVLTDEDLEFLKSQTPVWPEALVLEVDEQGVVMNRWGKPVHLSSVRTYMVTGAQELGLKVEIQGPFGIVGNVSYGKSFIWEGRGQDQ